MTSAGRPLRLTPTMNSSAAPALGTIDFTPLRTISLPSRRPVASGLSGSNSGRGSESTTAAAGTSSPAKAGR